MHVYITRHIPDEGISLLREAGHTVTISEKDGVLTKDELVAALNLHTPDAVICLLTDSIDDEVFTAAPKTKIFANYAVGYDNINLDAAKSHGVTITNTPGVLTDTVAEHTIAFMLTLTSRVAEADRFVRAGKYIGWAPELLLGNDLKDKKLGILGAGRIGSRVATIAHRGLGMHILYHDLQEDVYLNTELSAQFYTDMPTMLEEADVISIHIPLLDTTHHLINKEMLSHMKSTSYLINTSRGPIIDEIALYEALKDRRIKGAALDVFEQEPALTPGLTELENVLLTPHIGSATEETRGHMSIMAAQNVIDFLNGDTPKYVVGT